MPEVTKGVVYAMKDMGQLARMAALMLCFAAVFLVAQVPSGSAPPANAGNPTGKANSASQQKQVAEQKPARRKTPLLVPLDSGGDLKTPTTSAGRRGIACSNENAVLATLGPNRMGYGTALARPRLFWYLSVVPDMDCVATFWLLCDPADPGNQTGCPHSQFIKIDLTPVKSAGIQELQFSTFDKSVELHDGILYRWYISVGRPSDSPSKNDVDGAFIEKLASTASDDKLWYDRLAAAYALYEQGGESRALNAILSDVRFRILSDR